MAKKRVNITITDETKERILQYAQEGLSPGVCQRLKNMVLLVYVKGKIKVLL